MPDTCIFYASKALTSVRGFSRFALIFGVLLAFIALVLMPALGVGMFLFSVLAIYFIGIGIYHWRRSRLLSRAAFMIDETGLYVNFLKAEHFFPEKSIYIQPVQVAFSRGWREQVRRYPGLCLNSQLTIIDLSAKSSVDGIPQKHVGEPFLLEEDEFRRFLDISQQRGWLRNSSEESVFPAQNPGKRTRVIGYGLSALVCLLLFFFLSNSHLALASLLAALGLGGLALRHIARK